MGFKYNKNEVEAGLAQFKKDHPDYTAAQLENKRKELVVREFIVQLWTDTYAAAHDNPSKADILAYASSIRNKPEKNMSRAISWLSRMKEPRLSNYMNAIQELSDEAETSDFIERTLGYDYPVALNMNPAEIVSSKLTLGDAYFNGLFAAVTDPSGMKFDGIRQNKEMTLQQLKDKQKEADAIVIEANEAAGKDLIPYIVMGQFFTAENLKGMDVYLFSGGSTIPVGFNPVNGAKSNFFENAIKNDERMNMHAVRSFAPAARNAAKKIVDSKNIAGIKASLENCFNVLYNQAMSTETITGAAWIFPVRKLNEFIAETAKQGFKPEDLGISKEQLDNLKVMSSVYELQKKQLQLKAELAQAAENFICSKYDDVCNPYKNQKLMEAVEEQFVLNRALQRISHGIATVKLGYELAGSDAGETLIPKRPLSEEEKAYFSNPDEFLRSVRAEIKSLKGYQEAMAKEPSVGEAVNLLSFGISTSHEDNLWEEYRLDIFLNNALTDTLIRIMDTVSGTALEKSIEKDVLDLRRFAASKPDPYSSASFNTADKIFTRLNKKFGDYISHLSAEELTLEQSSRIAYLKGHFDAAADSCRYSYEKYKEIEAAEKWFAELKNVLKAQGINESDPYSLARICIINDTKFDVDKAFEDMNADERKAQFDEAGKLFTYAFMKQGPEGEYYSPRPAGKADLQWVKTNINTAASLSRDDILRLYKSAKDMRLIIRSFADGDESTLAPQYLVVRSDGMAACSESGDKYLPGPDNKTEADPERLGISEKDAQLMIQRETRRYQILFEKDRGRTITYGKGKFKNEEEFKTLHEKMNAEEIESKLIRRINENPELFKTPEQQQYQMQAMTISMKPVKRVTEEDKALLKGDNTHSKKFGYFMRSFAKRLGTVNYEEIMKSGKLLKADKTPFEGNDGLSFINRAFEESLSGNGVWFEYEKDGAVHNGIFVHDADFGLVPGVKITDYEARINQIRREFNTIYKEDIPGLSTIEDALKSQEKTVAEGISKKKTYAHNGTFSGIGAYIHRGKKAFMGSLPEEGPLSADQVRILSVLADIEAYGQTASSMTTDPASDTVKRIAIAAVCNRAAELMKSNSPQDQAKGRLLLTDSKERLLAADELMKNEAFLKRIEGKSPAELDDLREGTVAAGYEDNEELVNARTFARELSAQLKALGYDSPYSRALIRVRNDDILPDMINTLESSNEELKMQYILIEESSRFAFVPRDGNGNITEPRREGESRLEWIKRVSLSPENISDDQKLWLYRSAKAGRLHLQSDEMSVGGGQGTLILSGKDSKPLMGISLSELQEKPEAFGFLPDDARKISQNMNDNDSMQLTAGMILGGARITKKRKVTLAEDRLENKIAAAKEKNASKAEIEELRRNHESEFAEIKKEYNDFEKIYDDCYEMVYLNDVFKMAHSHAYWFNTDKDTDTVAKAIALGHKPQGEYTDEDEIFSSNIFLINMDANLLEKGLLKKGGFDSVQQMRESGKITDRLGNVITADSDFKYMNELARIAIGNGELFLDGKPYRLITGVGIAKGIDKVGYEAEAKYISNLFKKSGLKASSQGADYQYLAELMNELPEKIKAIEIDKGDNDIELKTVLSEAAAVGSAYIRSCSGKLSSAQLNCIKALNRLTDLKNKAFADEVRAEKGTEFKLAEKILTSYAIKNISKPDAREYMLDYSKRNTAINNLMKKPSFQTLAKESKKVGLDKVMRISGAKLYTQFEKLATQHAKDKNPPEVYSSPISIG